MKNKNSNVEKCTICHNCPICYKEASKGGGQFKMMRYFILLIVVLFIIQKLI